MTLNEVGFINVALHAMIKQKERLAALNKFKSNHVKILIATDVAARGLDITGVELVINHTIPNVPKEYIHRVGRTARAGKGGMAVSLITPYDIKLLHAIEGIIGTKLIEYKIDGKILFNIKFQVQCDKKNLFFIYITNWFFVDEEVVTILTQVSVAKREAEIKLDEADFYEKKIINKRKQLLLEGKDPEEIDLILQEHKKRRRSQKRKKEISHNENR